MYSHLTKLPEHTVLAGTVGTVTAVPRYLRYLRTVGTVGTSLYRRYSLDLRLLVIPLKVWGYPRNFGFTLRSLLMGRYDPATVTPALVEPEASESTARAARAPQAVQGRLYRRSLCGPCDA